MYIYVYIYSAIAIMCVHVPGRSPVSSASVVPVIFGRMSSGSARAGKASGSQLRRPWVCQMISDHGT